MGPIGKESGNASPEATRLTPKVVILGAGFGGLTAAMALRAAPVAVTIVDRENHHLFQPLLYQVATAGLSPADIARPIRGIVSGQRNCRVLLAEVTAVDPLEQVVTTEGAAISYDYLIVATGARHAYFGHDDWERVAPGLKTLQDATEIRRRILLAFEQAEAAEEQARRDRLLTFVIIGAGPTGVELAGAVAELARKALVKDFRAIDPGLARVVLVEAGPRVLASFPEELSTKAQRQLEGLGVEVLVGRPVTHCDAEAVVMDGGERIETACIIWAAGVQASPAARWLGAEADGAGRVLVDANLSPPGLANVFVIGDTATVVDAAGRTVPGVAPAAKQMGGYTADCIVRALRGESPPMPFRYRDHGNLATIGRKAAVADFGAGRHLSGLLAWLLWGFAHIYFLIGFRNRLAVMLDWIWNYVTFERGARLIIGRTSEARREEPPVNR